MRHVFRPDMTFLDIGANCGYYTALALSRMAGRGRIVAMEPHSASCKFLRRTVAANAAAIVTVIPKAAADRNAIMTLFTSNQNCGDNRLYANELSSESCPVETTTVDALLEELGIGIPKTHDLLKLWTLVIPHHGQLRSHRRGMKPLTDFAVVSRYPGANTNMRQTQSALRWAGKMREACRSLLGIPAPRRRKSP